MGEMEITADMRFYLTDPATGDWMRFNRDVAGSASLNVTWEPGRSWLPVPQLPRAKKGD